MQPAAPDTSKLPWWKQKRWGIAVLLSLVTAVGYVDRQVLSVTAPLLRSEFGFTHTEYGAIAAAFLLAYAIGQLVTGPLIDRLGTKRALSLAVLWWSIVAMLHAFGRGFASFFTFRVLLGFTEGANLPAAFKAMGEWFPRADRSLATGFITAGVGLGAIIAPPLVGWLAHRYGWQTAFLVPGAAGFLWLLIWRIAYHLPETHPRIDPSERELILAERAGSASEPGRPWHHYLRHREVWVLTLARFCGDAAFYFFAAWLPLYLADERDFNLLQIGAFAWMPFLAADIGSLGGGWLGRRLIHSGWSLDASRKTLIWVGALLMLGAMPAVGAKSPLVAIALISLALFAIQVKSSSLFPLAADLFPPSSVATIWGISAAAGSAGGALFQFGVGSLIDRYSYVPVFAMVSVTGIVQALLITIFIPRIRPIALPSP